MSELTPELCQPERSRMSQRDASEVEVEADSELSASSKVAFLDKVRQSNAACQSGDFETAVALYGEAIALDPLNHILYSNRSAAYIKLGQFNRALQDANKACEVNPKWPKAYYRQGVALQCLARHSDALAAFSSGLAQDPKSLQLLAGLVEAAMKSPLRATFEPTYRQLQAMRLDKSPFVIISVIGQELLAAAHYQSAVVVLESALRIGTCSLKLRGSVFSALSSAYWALSSLDKAISYMQQDLSVAKSLGDTAGEIRAHGNLGSAYFSKGNYKEALTSHRYQLVLAMKCKDNHAAAAALTSLGHVYTAIGDYPNALASHKQCLQLVKQLGDRLQEAREVGNVGAVYLAMADFDAAVNCHLEHLRIAKQLKNSVEMARAYSNLGSSHHFRRNFEQAITFHNHVLRIAEEIGIKSIEARAYAGLGHAARCMGDYAQAKRWHERQLDMALSTRDKVAEGRSLSNLGIVYQLLGDHDAALKLHQAHLNIARVLQDRAGMGRAYGNIGNAYSAMGYYEQAIKYHKQELTISKEVNDRSSEASTHGNLAVAYQALHMHDMAILHYHSHLNIARELKDTAGEACALLNLGNCHSSRGEFAQAVSFYENYLMLSQELQDVEGEAKACHFLGYAHYCLGNFKEAIRYYDQDLTLAKDLQDKMNMGRAYCNLGLAHLALGNTETALECQKYFLTIAHMTKHVVGKFRALGNIGDILVKMNNFDEAINVYSKQLQLAKQVQDKGLAASGYAALGLVHRHLRCFDKALGYYTQELTLRQESGDIKGECRSHGHLAAVHMALGNYTHAIKCYEEQLDRAKELRDSAIEAQVYGNLGIARLNMGHYEEAIGYFEQQLATLEQLSSSTALLDKGRAFGNLGDCYDALGDFEEAIKCHEQFLAIALKTKSLRDQERAYRGLGQSHRCLANLQQALVCFEKRLVVAHELNSPVAKGQAYGELGQLHSQLGNFEQAVSCLEHQLAIARELNDKSAEAEAASGLGCVFQAMGEYNQALQYHQLDLKLAEVSHNASFQCRAFGNLGVAHEALGQYEQAILYQEQHLSIAAQINDKVAKTMAFASLGRVHQTMGRTTQAIAYLQQGLQIAEALGRKEDEAKIRHRLGLALWSQGDLEPAHTHLDRAATLLEAIRREARAGADYRLSLFDLQTECYHVLQRILVLLNRPYEALLVAERGRTRAFVDLLLERQGAGDHHIREQGNRAARLEDSTPNSVEQMTEIVNKQKAAVLYYSLAAGYLYSWLILPSKGVVSFHQVSICEVEQSEPSKHEGNVAVNPSMLEQYIQSVRDALGVEMQTAGARENDVEGDMWSQHLEELGDKLNQDGDRTGFLRMVNRSHAYNSSNYSLSSLFSLGSLSGSITSGSTSRPGSTRSRRSLWQGPSCLRALYDLLVAPMESSLQNQDCRELMLVLEGDLYLVPFPVLKSPTCNEYLCERFSIIVVPSLSSLKSSMRKSKGPLSKNTDSDGPSQACVVGNPRLPATVTEQWGWGELPYAEQEANVVGEMLQISPLVGQQATKEAVIRQLAQAECIHLATHVSWKLSAIVLSPGDYVESSSKATPANSSHPSSASAPGSSHDEECASDMASSIDLPALSEFLLTAADILHLRLSARLVVISAVHTRDHHGWAHSDGVVGLSRALLAAGAQCVLLALWPVPDTAVKILFRTFYSSLMQGSRVSKALAEAQQTVQHTKHFAHPANWAGYMLIGLDIRLSNKVALMGQALAELLKTPENCRDALRVTLHLVEKSLQRIHRGHKNAMYTTQRSIENKVGVVNGWKELLISVGFRFEPVANNIPASVFFPQSDPGERLTQCSASLQALLGLSTTSLLALAKLLSNPESGDEIIHVMRHVTSQFALRDVDTESIEIPVAVKLWRLPGCHELLASLGFDLMEVGRDEVTLRTSKQANKRQIQFALQALLALFDTQEAPKSLSVDSSSSVESFPSDDEVEEHNNQRDMPLNLTYSNVGPTPAPRRFPLPLASSSKSAFTNYVRSRSRGEPDGRTAVTNEIRGRESDAAFTPSPVDLPPKKLSSSLISTLAVALSNNDSNMSSNETGAAPVSNLRMSLTLAHQNRIRSMYCSNTGAASSQGTGSPSSDAGVTMGLARPESSSSTSSVTDWENGQSTVRRQPVKHLPPLNRRVGDVSAFAHLPHAMAVNRMKEAAQAESNTQSSDSEVTVRKLPWKSGHSSGKKLGSPSASMAGSLDTLDRLSVRSEVGNVSAKGNSSAIASAKRRNRSTERSLQEDGAADYGRFMTGKLHVHPSGSKPSAELNASAKGGLSRANEELQNPVYSLRSAAEDFHLTQNTMGARNIQDHILANQLSRLEREFPISEVYHERDVGLGLAPSLSKILMTTTATDENSFVAANVAAPASEELFSTFDKMALDHVSPPKRAVTQRPWLSSKLTEDHDKEGLADLTRRDEADGRSMTDSNYSGYSPNRNLAVKSGANELKVDAIVENVASQKKTVLDRTTDKTGKSNTVKRVGRVVS